MFSCLTGPRSWVNPSKQTNGKNPQVMHSVYVPLFPMAVLSFRFRLSELENVSVELSPNRVRLFDMLTFLLTELNLADKLFMLSSIFVAMLNNSIKPVPNNNTSNPTQAA